MLSLDLPPSPKVDLGPGLPKARQLMVLLAVAHGGGGFPNATPDLDALHAAAAVTLRQGAQAKAQALGMDLGQLLEFSAPRCPRVEVRGENATMRRLDRIWAGTSLAEIEATRRACYVSPFHCLARWILVRGTARVDGAKLAPYTAVQIDKGQELALDPGTTVLVRRAPVPTLIETALAAGIAPTALLARALGLGDQSIATPIGKLSVDAAERATQIGQRRVRLTAAETAALGRLCREPGHVVSRQALARAMETSDRMVDRVIVQLRNKLGDGLITTVYGAGYLLEGMPAGFRLS